jgi:putative sigma-54 modulation protein
MNLKISGHHLAITPAIRDYLQNKMAKVSRHFEQVMDVDIILSVDKLDQKAEAKVHLSGKDLFCESIDADMYAAIDGLADKLDRAVLKHKEKLVDHHNQESIRRAAS